MHTDVRAEVQQMIKDALDERCAEHEKELKALQCRHNQQMISQRKVWQTFVEEAIKAQDTRLAEVVQQLTAWSDDVVAITLHKHAHAISGLYKHVTTVGTQQERHAAAAVALRDELDKHWRAISHLQCVD